MYVISPFHNIFFLVFEDVFRGTETQPEVGENLNYLV